MNHSGSGHQHSVMSPEQLNHLVISLQQGQIEAAKELASSLLKSMKQSPLAVPTYDGKGSVRQWVKDFESEAKHCGYNTEKDLADLARVKARSSVRDFIDALPEDVRSNWSLLKDELTRRFQGDDSPFLNTIKLFSPPGGMSAAVHCQWAEQMLEKCLAMSDEVKAAVFCATAPPGLRQELIYRQPRTLAMAKEIARNFGTAHSLGIPTSSAALASTAMEVDYASRGSSRYRHGKRSAKPCNKCKQWGHTEDKCPSKKKPASNQQTNLATSSDNCSVDDDEVPSELAIKEVCSALAQGINLQKVYIDVNGNSLDFVVDTGSQISIISTVAAKRLGLRLRPSNHSITSVDGASHTVQSTDKINICIGGVFFQLVI